MQKSSGALVVFLVVILFIIYSSSKKSKGSSSRTPTRNGQRFLDSRSGEMRLPYMTNDYNDYILNTGLESSVVESHRKFAEDMEQKTSGASAQTVFSHDEDPSGNGWRGLRRPNYNVYLDPNAREVPSSYKHQMPKNSKYDSCGLF